MPSKRSTISVEELTACYPLSPYSVVMLDLKEKKKRTLKVDSSKLSVCQHFYDS